MFLSQVYETARIISGQDSWQIDYYYPIIASSYEKNSWISICNKGYWAMCFWSYCSTIEAKKIVETQDYNLYEKTLLKRNSSGDVAIVYLVVGKIFPYYKDLFKKTIKDRVKYILYYKTKLKKFYLMEV